MNYRKVIICVWLMLCAGIVSAQEERNSRVTIGMNNLNYTKQDQKAKISTVFGAIADAIINKQVTTQRDNYQDAVRAAIVKGFSQARRITVIDGKLSNDEVARPNAYYVDATVSNVSTTSKTEQSADKKKTITYFKGVIGVILHIKDAHTDEVVASPTFNVSDTDVSWVETAEGALNNALVRLSSAITAYSNRWLPLSANIIEGARDKKDKQKEVYIDLGSREGASKGLHLAVYTMKTIAGKEAKKQIGRLKIESVEGNDISLCKVQSGGKDIKAAIDAGETLLVQTTD